MLLSPFTKFWFIEFNFNEVHKVALHIHAIEEMVLTERKKYMKQNQPPKSMLQHFYIEHYETKLTQQFIIDGAMRWHINCQFDLIFVAIRILMHF